MNSECDFVVNERFEGVKKPHLFYETPRVAFVSSLSLSLSENTAQSTEHRTQRGRQESMKTPQTESLSWSKHSSDLKTLSLSFSL